MNKLLEHYKNAVNVYNDKIKELESYRITMNNLRNEVESRIMVDKVYVPIDKVKTLLSDVYKDDSNIVMKLVLRNKDGYMYIQEARDIDSLDIEVLGAFDVIINGSIVSNTSLKYLWERIYGDNES